MVTLKAKRKTGNINNWQERHDAAITAGGGYPIVGSTERAMVKLLTAWSDYALAHQKKYESLIGDDGFLGPEWEAIGDSLRALLNGDFGPRLDGGTLDAFILDTMAENGVDVSVK